MELINAIILLLSTVLALLGATITFISKFIKSTKDKKMLENLTIINTAVSGFMIEAENFKGYSGFEKKEYVISCAKGFAMDNGIAYDEKSISDAIEKLIKFSKNVNQKLKKSNKKEKEGDKNGL